VRGDGARHCGDQYSILFHYYSLGGDTAMPSRLHARLCHAILVIKRYTNAVFTHEKTIETRRLTNY